MSKNPSIGTCPCPITGCDETCSVHRFATRAMKDSGRRFGGKLYIVCKKHGSLGLAAPREMQEFILAHANIPPGHVELEAPPPVVVPAPAAATPRAAPVTDPPKPAPARPRPDPPPAAKRKREWGSVLDE